MPKSKPKAGRATPAPSKPATPPKELLPKYLSKEIAAVQLHYNASVPPPEAGAGPWRISEVVDAK